ncbi:hypothetical protein [Klebsiella aerogenes]|uniref:hypothetical protein n=5 Tax=Gammaproteobacteria TaxID=1236 RepID=UPI0037B4CA76
MTDKLDSIITAANGRDAGKRFKLTELGPVASAGMMLRLVSALRVDSYEDLLARLRESSEDGAPPIDEIMQVLQGCDPDRVQALVREALQGVQVAPDPKHPEAFRPMTEADIAELRTLGELLMAFSKLNFGAGL